MSQEEPLKKILSNRSLASLIADFLIDSIQLDLKEFVNIKHLFLLSFSNSFRSLNNPDCRRFLGPLVSNRNLFTGARVPGTQFELDPVKAVFDHALMTVFSNGRFHINQKKTDGFSLLSSCIISICDFVSRQRLETNYPAIQMRQCVEYQIKAVVLLNLLLKYLKNDRPITDSMLILKMVGVAINTRLLGGNKQEIINGINFAIEDGSTCLDEQPEHRARWIKADAVSRTVTLAYLSLTMENSETGDANYDLILNTKFEMQNILEECFFYDTSSNFEINSLKFESEHGDNKLGNFDIAEAHYTQIEKRIKNNLLLRFPGKQVNQIMDIVSEESVFDSLQANEFFDLFII